MHTGAIGHYVARIAEEGLIGLGFVAGMPNMAYTGAKGPAVATGPLAVAVPARAHAPLVLGMATATIALGKIRQAKAKAKAKANGTPLPEGAAATADGTPTTDPAQAVMPLPLGGAKGSGMSLAFELLTSVLVGAPILAAFRSEDPAGRKHRQNALFTALDPAAFDDPEAFVGAVDTTPAAVKGLPVAGGRRGGVPPRGAQRRHGRRARGTESTGDTEGVARAAGERGQAGSHAARAAAVGPRTLRPWAAFRMR
ncbi:Ldh family oxidoreductase [Streptomyces incanus]|uniref:Ldh family oxidoreductase n=1 Tax=Streptomyces incanus TaxID=887453 RepID=A0ABW0Y0U8_9ACTN